MTMSFDQRLVRIAAERQADERAEREGVACMVYRRIGFPTIREVTWYVRTAAEGVPEGCAAPEYVAAAREAAQSDGAAYDDGDFARTADDQTAEATDACERSSLGSSAAWRWIFGGLALTLALGLYLGQEPPALTCCVAYQGAEADPHLSTHCAPGETVLAQEDCP